MYRSIIAGCGAYLPANVVSNTKLSETVDTTDKWIVERTGIEQRHIAADGELTSDLGREAAIDALQNANISASDIDLIVVATATPDETFPATATRIQAQLGVTKGCAFDVQAVCSGFIYALAVADNFVRVGQAKNALVIGAETFSRILDWKDRATCVLFGDGAGAVVLTAEAGSAAGQKNNTTDPGILSTHLHSDGRHHDMLYVDGGVSSTGTAGYLRMQGNQVFRHAVTNLSAVVEEALAHNGLKAEDIDWIVPHQANRRIIDSTAKRIGLDTNKVVLTVQKHGNTSAASVPLALHTAVSDGRIKRGDMVLMEAMGGGFTWGAALARW